MQSQVNVPFNRPALVGDELNYVRDAISRNQLSGDGEYTGRCHRQIEQLTGSSRALLTHSCTAALEMAAMLCDLEEGDEVIMPSFTFVSTANAVVLRRAVPIFVDIDPKTLNIDPNAVSMAITPRTKAIFAVHYAGVPAEMDALQEIATAHNLLLVEDAAQALGSTYNGRLAGSLGDLGAFSFHETKNIISGEGGALTINRAELVDRAQIIRQKGTNRDQFLRGMADKYSWMDIGSSFLPGELTAAFLYGQLEQHDTIYRQRMSIFKHYLEAFASFQSHERVTLPHVPEHCTTNGHLFYLLMRSHDDRNAFIDHMRTSGIATPFHYVPLHSSPAGRKYGRSHGAMSNTDAAGARLVRLPIYLSLETDIDSVISCATDFLNRTE